MRLKQHVLISAGISGLVFAATKSPAITISSFFAGFLIDIDHIIDYWITHPFKMNIWHFFEECDNYRLERIILIAHSLELIIPIALGVYYTRSPILLGISIGWAHHMIIDAVYNNTHPDTYFLIARIIKKFDNKKVFKFD